MILPSMEGVNGFLIPLLDGGGALHLVINMRPSANQRTGIYYAPRAEPDWAPIVPVAIEEPYGPTAHYTDATIRLGNEIHVVWTQLRQGEIWYVRGVIGLMEPAAAQPTPTPIPSTPTPTPLPVEPAAGAAEAGSQGRVWGPAPATEQTKLAPVALAVAPVLLVVVGIAAWQGRRR